MSAGKEVQQVAVPQGFGELIRVAAWLLSPEPMRAVDALEEKTHIGHRQFSAAQAAMREMLRLKAIAVKDAADMLAAVPKPPQPPQAERVPMDDDHRKAIIESAINGKTEMGEMEYVSWIIDATERAHGIGVKT